MFYRSDSNKASWHGPATVLGSRGSVYFLAHQKDVVRVAACRIVSTRDVDGQISVKDKEIAKVPSNCVKEMEEAPGIYIEPGQQEQEAAPEDIERHEPERLEPIEMLEEAEGQEIKRPEPERL